MPTSMLSKVQTGPVKRNHFVLLYGVDGVGKSTFGANAPKPIFLGPEDGLGLLDVARFPSPANWQDIKRAVSDLINEDHPYKTLVVDSLDWIEPLVWAYVCAEDSVQSIEQVEGGFGKGYVRAVEQWNEFIKQLTRLRSKMHIVLIGHSQIRVFNDPAEDGQYDRYLLKLNEKAGARFREAVDCVLFANFETRLTKKKGALKARAFGDGARVVFTERRPAFDAKNRFNLPFQMPLSWDEFALTVEQARPAAETTDDELTKLLEGREEQAHAYLASIGWLTDEQTIHDLSPTRRQSAVNRGDALLAAIDEHAAGSTNETETTTTHASAAE